VRTNIAEHMALLDRIEADDPAGAAALLRDHLLRAAAVQRPLRT
jgi:DNA-binding GntR family transcriptional regulator